jgi:hypothetical protein
MSSRVLVSNLGDGNWGDGTENQITTNATVYFPPGNAKGTQPTAAQCFNGSIDYVGWSAKTNWMVQVDGTYHGTPGTLTVSVCRPTGVEEVVYNAAAADFTFGGIGGEEIYGPLSYIRFTLSGAGGAGNMLCYVVAWNYGDIIDGTLVP